MKTQTVWKCGHNYSNLTQAKCYFTSMSNASCLITVPNMKKISPHSSLRYYNTLKMYLKNCHNYSNLAQNPNSILHASVTQYEENASSHHGGMYKNGQTDLWTGPLSSSHTISNVDVYLFHLQN